MDSKRGKTGLVYDRRMTHHRCLWNDQYPECPERFTRILDRCSELNLIDRCHPIASRSATISEILLKHTQEQYDILKATDGESNEQKLEEICTHYDVFIHPSTFESSLLAVGCAIELVDKILLGEVQNGMAIIRPPGHHATETDFDGFCFFNNVAIAAQHAIDNHGVKRILIVDFDVHHGQGTQQMFYNDPRVLYFSVHCFDYGMSFPGLRESDFDYVGEDRGEGFNFNVALNEIGMTNADYLAIWQQILLPVAIEFQPELVLVSAGYDAAYGCPLGEMEITPACYAHLISPLMALAKGKIAAFLEGGYNLESLAESAAITLRTFLGDPCPRLEMLDEPKESLQESILNCTQTHKAFWKCLQVHREYSPEAVNADQNQSGFHQVIQNYCVNEELHRGYYNPREVLPNQLRSKCIETKINKHLQHLKSVTKLDIPLNRVCFVAPFVKIGNVKDINLEIDEFLVKYDLLDRLHKVDISSICHKKWHSSSNELDLSSDSMTKLIDPNFWESFKPAMIFKLLNNVLEGKFQNGVCFEFGESVGTSQFSIFHNIAAQFAIDFHDLKRVLIIDWDKRDDSGTQKYSNPKVLYMSLHQGGNDGVYPETGNANRLMTGVDGGGVAVNIPLNKETVNDADYIAAFQRIIMPIAYEFNPELVLVSTDFDAIGIRKTNVSPESFGYFTQWLSSLANGRIILCIKGEYNSDSSISIAMATCVKALLGDPLPILKSGNQNISNIKVIQDVISVQQKYFKLLKFNQILPALNQIRT